MVPGHGGVRYRNSRALGVCTRCGEMAEKDRALCAVCREKQAAETRRWRAKRRAAGLCQRCGAPCDGSYCAACGTKHAARLLGVRVEDVERLRREQGGRCAICGTTDPKGTGAKRGTFHIDHDHETGALRGLLCTKCNLGLGCFEDDPERLTAAAVYLCRLAVR